MPPVPSPSFSPPRARRIPSGVALMLALSAATAGAQTGAQTGSCGQPEPTGAGPSSMAANNVSDLSLAYQAEQPASITMCAYGYLAAKCGDYATAHKIFDKCIAKGFIGPMIWKGHLLQEGEGVPQDSVAATAMFKRAAESGHDGYAVMGKLHYASALWEGRGVARNEAEARKWFEQAAAEGSEDAQTFLKTGYHTGSRDRTGKGVGVPTEDVQGQALQKQPTATTTAFSGWYTVGMGALLALLVAIGAWRQGRTRLAGIRLQAGGQPA